MAFSLVNGPQVRLSLSRWFCPPPTQKGPEKCYCEAQTHVCLLQTYTAPATGNYLFTVAGGQGGTTTGGSLGGLGATVTATVFLQQLATVTIIVGGQGSSGGNGGPNQPGAGGGGVSAVYTNGPNAPTIVAGIYDLFKDVAIILYWCPY